MSVFTPEAHQERELNDKVDVTDGMEILAIDILLTEGGRGPVSKPKSHQEGFTSKELCQHVGLYNLNGLSPSPCLKYKQNHREEVKFMAVPLSIVLLVPNQSTFQRILLLSKSCH